MDNDPESPPPGSTYEELVKFYTECEERAIAEEHYFLAKTEKAKEYEKILDREIEELKAEMERVDKEEEKKKATKNLFSSTLRPSCGTSNMFNSDLSSIEPRKAPEIPSPASSSATNLNILSMDISNVQLTPSRFANVTGRSSRRKRAIALQKQQQQQQQQ